MASDLAIVSGLTGWQKSRPAANARGHRRAARGLGAVEDRQLALEQAHLEPLLEAAGDLGEQRAGGDRSHDPVGQLKAELLGGLEGQGLGALGVVRDAC